MPTVTRFRKLRYEYVSAVIDIVFMRESIAFRTGLKSFIQILCQSVMKSVHLSRFRFRIRPILPSAAAQLLQRQNSSGLDDLMDIDRILFIPECLKSKISLQNGAWIFITPAAATLTSDTFMFKSIFQILFYGEEEMQKSSDLTLDNDRPLQFKSELSLTPMAEYNMSRTCGLSCLSKLKNNSREFRLTLVLSAPKVCAFSSPYSFRIKKATLLELTPLKRTGTDVISDIECDMALNLHFKKERYLSIGNIVSVGDRSNRNSPIFDLVVTKINEVGQNEIIVGHSETQSGHRGTQVFTASSDYTTLFVRSTSFLNDYHPCDLELIPKLIPPVLLNYSKQIVDALTFGVAAKTSKFGSSVLLSGGSGSGLLLICRVVSQMIGVNFYPVNMVNLIGDTSAYTEAKLKNLSQQIKLNRPCLLVMKNIHLVGKDKEGQEDKRVLLAFRDFLRESEIAGDDELNSFLVGISCHPEKASRALTHSFQHHIRVSPVMATSTTGSTTKEDERRTNPQCVIQNKDKEMLDLIQWIIQIYDVDSADHLCNWIMTNGLSRRPSLKEFEDIVALIASAVRKAYEAEQRKNDLSATELCKTERIVRRKWSFKKLVLDESHLIEALDELDHGFGFGGNNFEVGRIPQVNWEDIGGLSDIKSELINSIQLPLRFPHLFQSGLRRSGILLYGPPGTGKTLVAKAVATEFKLGFISVKGPELLNMYVGQSEQNVREVFQKARNCAPCVVFFDELDALAPNRGKSGDSGGVMDRRLGRYNHHIREIGDTKVRYLNSAKECEQVVSQILAEMDGTHNKPSVFVLGATNRPDLIDPALLRPGRFDKLLYIGVSSDKHTRKKILQALTRKFHLSPDVDLDDISENLPNGMTGADLSSFCSNAYMAAVEKRISLLDSGVSTDAETAVRVSQDDFKKTMLNVTVSLSPKDISNYEKLRHMKR